jgi:phospholipase C
MSINFKRFGCLAGALAVTLLTGMSADQTAQAAGQHPAASSARDRMITAALRDKVQNIVVIYAENRAFDNLYGNFPGARGLREVVPARSGSTW